MLIIDVKDNETIDKALRRYKKKFEKAGVLKQIRSRKHFTKPSINQRAVKLKAIYRQQMINAQEL
jgi:small subunit ribosomal protein S21